MGSGRPIHDWNRMLELLTVSKDTTTKDVKKTANIIFHLKVHKNPKSGSSLSPLASQTPRSHRNPGTVLPLPETAPNTPPSQAPLQITRSRAPKYANSIFAPLGRSLLGQWRARNSFGARFFRSGEFGGWTRCARRTSPTRCEEPEMQSP